MKQLITLFVGIVFSYSAYSQDSVNQFAPNFTNYSIEDGLPSNEVYHVYCDKKGIIWMATDNGVCRLDGHGLKVYTTEDGLSDNVVFKFHEDKSGRLWCSTANHKLCYFQNDSIITYKYNSIISENVPGNAINLGLVVDSTDKIHLGYTLSGYYTIDSTGQLEHYGAKGDLVIEKAGIHLKPIENTVLSFFYNNSGFTRNIKWPDPPIAIFLDAEDNNKTTTLTINRLKKGGNDVNYSCRIQDSIFAFIWGSQAYVISGKQSLILAPLSTDGIYINSIDNRLWVGTRQNGIFAHSLDKPYIKTDHFLEDYSVTSVCTDQEGGYWFSTLENGVYYTPSLDSRSYLDRTKKSNALSMTTWNSQNIYVGYDDGFIDDFSVSGLRRSFNTNLENKYNSIYDLDVSNDTLICSGPKCFDVALIGNLSTTPRSEHISIKKLHKHSNGKLYGIAPGTITVLKNKVLVELANHNLKVQGVEEFGEGIVLATTKGLWVYKGDQVSVIESTRDDQKFNVVSIKEYQGKYYFVTKNGLFYSMESNGQVTQHTYDYSITGYSAINITDEGGIWIASNKGLIQSSVDNPDKCLAVMPAEGLPSGVIKNIQITDQHIWLLTNAGPSYVKRTGRNIRIPQIQFLELMINGNSIKLDDSLVVPYNLNQLEFTYAINSYRNSKDIVYRHFLRNHDLDTTLTQSRSAKYSSINPGQYVFSVSASLDGIIFSDETKYHITIQKPFWLTAWFIALEALLVIATILGVIKYRINLNSRKHRIKEQLVELRSQALRAQMNPHFTYNALNSIQSYIALNENEIAAIYLADFAKLMRKTLDASSNDLHTLEEELDIVRIYLGLEKVRFKERIDYEINVDSSVNPMQVQIPPMIIQPLVENSIIHGILPKKSAGLVKIDVRMESDSTLRIQIEDDGVGMGAAPKTKYKSSKGLKIIEERLVLSNGDNQLVFESPEDGRPGTIVQVIIQINV